MAKPSPVKIPTTTLDDYAHSPFHYAVVLGDHAGLTRLVSSLPKLTEPEQFHTESDSISQERVAEIISAVIDRRDVPFRETPLHLAVRIGDVLAVKTISSAGADAALRNVAGWNALDEAVCRGNAEITEIILRHQRRSGWCKWRRRLPDDDVSSPGTLLVLNREEKTISNAFENAAETVSEREMDVTKAELVEMKNWRGKEKVETVGEWKAKRYEVKNVSFSLKSPKVVVAAAGETEQNSPSLMRQLSCSEVEEKEVQPSSSRRRRKSVSLPPAEVPAAASGVPRIKGKETVKSLSPSVWLTNDFPLTTEELLPVLDILAINVEAVRRMKELLTVKFPPGTLPVKMSIPVIPTVKVVITFSKFVALPSMDQFYTPVSSPSHISAGVEDQCDVESDTRTPSTSRRSFSTPSWLRLKATKKSSQRRLKKEQTQMVDPFTIPAGLPDDVQRLDQLRPPLTLSPPTKTTINPSTPKWSA
ncbi:hypothetical protein Bca101_092458 [Brassica carinata]